MAKRRQLANLTVAVTCLVLGPITRVRAEDLVRLTDSRPGAAAEIASEGDAPGATALRMQVYLAPRHQAKLDRLLEAQQDPASPKYNRWLSAAAYDRRFGPTQKDVEEITGWLTGQGFSVTFASASQGRIAFEGDVATAQSSFRVRIAGSNDGNFGNVSDPRVPASLAPKISYLAGLHNLSASTVQTIIADPNNNNMLTAPHFGPPDVWVYHNATQLLQMGMNGSGVCIAALEGSDVDQASLTDFNTVFGLPPFVQGQNYDTVYPDGPAGIQPPLNGTAQAYSEALVDIEYAHGLAPGAQIVLYAGNYAGLRTQGLVNTLKAATADNRCGVIIISWAQCGEPKAFYRMLDRSYQRGVAQGQTIFVATGDVGVGGPIFDPRTHGCRTPPKPRIEENAASPNVTACGATQVGMAQYDANGLDSGVGVPEEQVWYFDYAHLLRGATTGGVSTVFKKPKFQKGIKSVKFRKRAVPDICIGAGFPARPGYWECLDFGLYTNGVPSGATCSNGGGSSLCPPQWGGIIAIIQQKKGGRTGNINPQLYAMAKSSLNDLAAMGIRDVTQGHNSWYPLTGYDAKPGYDLASGWGSVDIGRFVSAYLAYTPPGRR